MVIREINKLTLSYLGKSYPCSAPVSVYSALASVDEKVDRLIDTAMFSAEFTADSLTLGAKYIFLRLCELKADAEIFLNGASLGNTNGILTLCNRSIASIVVEGVNRLEIRFPKGTTAYQAGIFTPMQLYCFNSAAINKISLSQRHEDGIVTLGINLDMLGSSDNVRAVATLVSSTGQIYYGGLTRGRGSITLRDPLYWWPKGFGVQNLYKLTINLYGENEIEDTVDMRIGLRKIAVKEGRAALIVNGMEILPMGATYYPDRYPAFSNYDRKVEGLITSAAMANYNCIVIPWDAERPSEKFYELCDLHGIMVIEEIETLTSADLDHIERKSYHPCLALIDLAGVDDGDLEKINAASPNLKVTVFEDFNEYVSAYSLPTDKTLWEKLPSDEKNLFSYSMEKISPKEITRQILSAVADRYPYPKNLSDFTYASALASSARVSEGLWRARFSGNTQRAIFGTLGDEGVVASSSAMDSSSRWKALQYQSAKSFAPLAVHATLNGSTVSIRVSNMRRSDLIGSLEYRIVDSENVTVYTNSQPCEVSAFTEQVICEQNFAEYISGHEREYYLEYSIKEGVVAPTEGTLLFAPEKHFKFKKPSIKAEVAGSDRRFSVTLSANCFVKNLELSFDGVDAVFSENYFDITSSSPIKINVTVIGGLETAYHLNQALRLRSVYDLMR